MSAKRSAGLLAYRKRGGTVEVFLVHPGGPFWARKDAGAWTIPKGEIGPGEDELAAARREMAEETGFTPGGEFHPLPPIRQKAGKVVVAWAVETDCDPAELRSNSFSMEWPPRSGGWRNSPRWTGPAGSPSTRPAGSSSSPSTPSSLRSNPFFKNV